MKERYLLLVLLLLFDLKSGIASEGEVLMNFVYSKKTIEGKVHIQFKNLKSLFSYPFCRCV